MKKKQDENLYPLGCNLVEDDPRNYAYANLEVGGSGGDELPESFELDTPHTYQGKIDSCVGHAVAGAKSTQEKNDRSPRFLWSLCKREQNYGGWGTNVPLALKQLQKIGTPKLETIPEDPTLTRIEYMKIADNVGDEVYQEAKEAKIKSYWYIYSFDTERIKRALYNEKVPLITTLMWYSEYNHPDKDGFLPTPKNKVSGHAVRFIGWKTIKGRVAFKFKNSWRKGWGVDNNCFFVWEDELRSVYNFGTFFVMVDIPKEKAKLIDKYQGKLIKNKDNPKVYYVHNKDIIWIQDEGTFILGKKLWGDWNEIITIPEEVNPTKTISLKDYN